MRHLHTITPEATEAVIADNIVMREEEYMSYQINIENYTAMLAKMPQGEWPEHLVQYKGVSADRVPEQHTEEVNTLNYRDRITALLKTERQEQAKGEAVLDVLLEKIPVTKRSAAIQAAVQRRIAANNP